MTFKPPRYYGNTWSASAEAVASHTISHKRYMRVMMIAVGSNTRSAWRRGECHLARLMAQYEMLHPQGLGVPFQPCLARRGRIAGLFPPRRGNSRASRSESGFSTRPP